MRAVFAPLETELLRLRELIEADTIVTLPTARVWHGRIGTRDLCLVRTGWGEAALRAAVEYTLRTFPISEALLVGFGGGALPNLHMGDLLIAATLRDTATGQQWETAPPQLAQLQETAANAGLESRVGTIVVHGQMSASPHEKAFLGTQHQAAAITMEGLAFAEAMQARDLSWGTVRAIFDPMERPMPDGFFPLHPDGTLAIGEVLRHLVQHPGLLGQLSQLHLAATRARETLTTFTKAWLSR